MACPYSIGLGFDVHRLSPGYKLKICGIEIPYEMGLEAHSDGDVALHALCDALLGAAALGDIGVHFPPSDNAYKGIDSSILLARVINLVTQEGWHIGNIDLVIIAQAPKMAPHIPAMQRHLSSLLGSDVRISIKATTTEHLGYTGRKEGIATQASALLYR